MKAITPSIRSSVATIVVALILAAGCSTTPIVDTQTKTGANLAAYHTFALMPLPQTAPVGDPGLMMRLSGPAQQAVAEAMTARGYTAAAREQADLSVNLRGESLPKVEVTQWGYNQPMPYGRYERYSAGGGLQGTEVQNFERRTLSVEIFDNKTKEMVWVGWSSRDSRGPVEVERVTNAIHAILQKYPAAAKSPAP